MIKKQKIEIKKIEDIARLPENERDKWEVAAELGLFDKIVDGGWKKLTARDRGNNCGAQGFKRKKLTCTKAHLIKRREFSIICYVALMVNNTGNYNEEMRLG